jgi:hypothetical protein
MTPGLGCRRGDLFLDRLNDLVPVPRLLGNKVKDHQAEIAVGEETAEASSSPVSPMPIMTEV